MQSDSEVFNKVTEASDKLLAGMSHAGLRVWCIIERMPAGYLNVYSDPREKVAQRIQFDQPEGRARVRLFSKSSRMSKQTRFPMMAGHGSIKSSPKRLGCLNHKVEWLTGTQQSNSLAQLDPKKMSIKELRAYLDSQGVSYKGIVEKEDLEAKASQVLDKAKKARETSLDAH
eukprot:752318-Hanusia_phi.AAC.1